MATYHCVPLSTPEALRYRAAAVDDFGYPIQRFVAHETYPCRHCLREASADQGLLLLSHQAPAPRSVYGHPTAIFLCAQACGRFDEPDTVPEIVRNRHVSFRAFKSDGMMLYGANELVEGGGHDAAIRRIFDREDVDFINAHTAKAGCMLCLIVRSKS
jgi:Protein of unknown function (DUF1203)